ncbi:MAG: hypothetical protein K1X53_05520 [Candidatus Sumerlaeaceae bacterium]|nr:hypothetical protein [Candidatus Sumerlaeaceae bacterium]
MLNEDLTPVPDPFGDDITGLSKQPLPDPIWPDGPPKDPREDPDPDDVPEHNGELVFYENDKPVAGQPTETVNQVLGQTIGIAAVACRRLFHSLERRRIKTCDPLQLTQRVADVNAGIYALAQLYRLHLADENIRRDDPYLFPRKRRPPADPT